MPHARNALTVGAIQGQFAIEVSDLDRIDLRGPNAVDGAVQDTHL